MRMQVTDMLSRRKVVIGATISVESADGNKLVDVVWDQKVRTRCKRIQVDTPPIE